MGIATISPRDLYQIVQSGQSVELIDVRTPVEYRELHVMFARNIPLDRLDPNQVSAGKNGSDQTLYLICRSGSRGKQACEKLLTAGFERIINVEGGTQAWAQAGLPVVRGKKCMSLERQVRIAAGALALAGAVLSMLVHPYWAALSGFVGAGLIFAGITDSCPMATCLARMPWNQVPASDGGELAVTSCTSD